ncbi:hypothetical protein CMQ_6773 [Grosmannia clavigera kw1407]|uniref:Glucan 4-alpha-glucosidase n=1 Tax=Grosmannia clavigera (strain kw1407 / UAMH 11150) TaxID=655863 RepID=F0X7Z6_GROCL|nr:uncharacterized protein CMQ_6773 [Grosmannia clavigera kw1407]EFX06452.1 hypothetical protein CMQ_6773 [Grosmannia clavigera kw1407]
MSSQSPQKRPRLSLQIKALSTGPSIRTSRTLAAVVNPSSPTAFNTLSNVYSTAIDRSASVQLSLPTTGSATPMTAIQTTSSSSNSSSRKRLSKLPRLQMPDATTGDSHTQTPYVTTQFPETPLTAHPLSPSVAAEIQLPSAAIMTATPPLSAGPIDSGSAAAQMFCFSPDGSADRSREFFDSMHVTNDDRYSRSRSSSEEVQTAIDTRLFGLGLPPTRVDREVEEAATPRTSWPAVSSQQIQHQDQELAPPLELSAAAATNTNKQLSRRRATRPATLLGRQPPPYQHPRSLHSILRNSPLPPPSARSPVSPRRQSQRLFERASRHVMYNSPLTQTITTNTYTRSHIDLLCEEASPFVSPAADETRDGGTTPGPFEEMRRRMAGLGSTSAATTPVSPVASLGVSSGGIRKRKNTTRRDKKRRWVWTLGQDDDGEVDEEHLSGAMAALRAAMAAEKAAAEEKPLQLQNQTADHEIEMQDATTTAPLALPPPPPEADKARKRKSTPVPYDLDNNSHDEVETQTPTMMMSQHLQGACMQAAEAAAAAASGTGDNERQTVRLCV